MENNTTTIEQNGQTPNVQPGQTPTNETNGQTPSGQTNSQIVTSTKFEDLPADVQAMIKSLRSEAASYRKDKEQAQKEKEASETAKLTEQGEFKKLAEQREARVKELEPVLERYTALEERVTKQFETSLATLPDEIKALDPGKDAGIAARLDWFDKMQPLVAKLKGVTAPGNSRNPAPAGTQSAKVQPLVNVARKF